MGDFVRALQTKMIDSTKAESCFGENGIDFGFLSIVFPAMMLIKYLDKEDQHAD